MNKLATINIKGKEYVTVAERVRYFNETYPNGMIETDISFDGELVRSRAKITPDTDKPQRYFIGHAEENREDGMVNKTSAVENCETSSIGRALGLMGIGIIDGIASADEIILATADRVLPVTLSNVANVNPQCTKCKAPMITSKSTGKIFCSAKCWLQPKNEEIPF